MSDTIIDIKVIPNAMKTEIVEKGDIWKIKICAPPVQGKANKELVALLSKEFNVPKYQITIVFGEKSQIKRIKITK